VPVTLGRIFRRKEAGPALDLIPFGHRCIVSAERLRVESGPLSGTTLRIERGISSARADFGLYRASNGSSSDPVAHCHFDRDPQTGMETMWGIFVHAEYRHRGLAAVLIRLAFRELLASGRRHWFGIRKMMRVDTEGQSRTQPSGIPRIEPQNPQTPRITLHNLGIGLLAVRLGLRPEPGLSNLLAPGNVKIIQALPAELPIPPGLLLRLESLPGLLVAALLDPDTGLPLTDPAAYETFFSPRQLLRQAMAGDAVIGNIDYILSRASIEPFAARLADDHAELRRFTAALRRGTRI